MSSVLAVLMASATTFADTNLNHPTILILLLPRGVEERDAPRQKSA